ncbi:hypothetical protein [Demequina mangrovi]|uniref:Thioredoxin domain-containing protein n=1 Tax=Demequina mangrovi TaxID=1043493 RepID=A0A1H6U7D2_9MICO|nr:hypothetical protein [Demequina mangrovi]SEI88259.1 hypothetical protein SAMN05421637_0295 [Demequina mangrovi]
MQVDVLVIEGCVGRSRAVSLVRAALDTVGHPEVPVGELVVASEADARGLDFRGSPTIVVDGADLLPEGPRVERLACRVYATWSGLADVPDAEVVVAALRCRLDG